jgi:hypothetical protein
LSSGFVLARNQEETLSLMGYFSEIVRDHRGNDD